MSSSAAGPEFPQGAPNPFSEGEGGPARNCLGSFLATRHPPWGGKVSPFLQEGRVGALRPPEGVWLLQAWPGKGAG